MESGNSNIGQSCMKDTRTKPTTLCSASEDGESNHDDTVSDFPLVEWRVESTDYSIVDEEMGCEKRCLQDFLSYPTNKFAKKTTCEQRKRGMVRSLALDFSSLRKYGI